MAQWVRSKYSEGARKFRVESEWGDRWWVELRPGIYSGVPKEEYVLTDPPERWEVCTREVVHGISCPPHPSSWLIYGSQHVTFAKLYDGQRWAWDTNNPNALVIERKVEG